MNTRVGLRIITLMTLSIVVSNTVGQQPTSKPTSTPRPINRPRGWSQMQVTSPRATPMPQRQRNRPKMKPRTQTVTSTPLSLNSSNMTIVSSGKTNNGGFSHADFLTQAEMFFKNATRRAGMSKRGSDAAWNILVKYSSVDEIDPTKKISAEEEKQRMERLQKMKNEIRKTLNENDRRKLAELERGLKMEIDKRMKTTKAPIMNPVMVEPMER